MRKNGAVKIRCKVHVLLPVISPPGSGIRRTPLGAVCQQDGGIPSRSARLNASRPLPAKAIFSPLSSSVTDFFHIKCLCHLYHSSLVHEKMTVTTAGMYFPVRQH